MDYTITRCNNDDWVKVNGKNAKGETLEIQICHMKNSASPSSIMNTWYREGYIDTILDTYLICHTYVLDSEGNGFMGYDITSKLSEDGKRHVINFEWLLEDTPENMIKIIEACIDLFKSATGKSATEEKVERINKYAEENGLTVTYAEVIIPLSSARPTRRLVWSFCKSVNLRTISPAFIMLYPSNQY